MYPIGTSRGIVVTGAANVLSLDFRPQEGFEQIICWAIGFHSGANSQNLSWNQVDPVTGSNIICAAMSRGKDVEYPLPTSYQSAKFWTQFVYLPPKLTRDKYFQLKAAALDAGAHLYIHAWVIERPENYDLIFQEMIAHYMKMRLPIQSRE